jgi:GxxExxY protein
MTEAFKYSDITGKIIGCAMEVHKFLGNGFQEVIYQRALAIELERIGLNYQREIEQHLYYKDVSRPIGTRRADFIVENCVLVELKAVVQLEEVYWAQILNYLKAYQFEVGLLINFGAKSLELKRFVFSEKNI